MLRVRERDTAVAAGSNGARAPAVIKGEGRATGMCRYDGKPTVSRQDKAGRDEHERRGFFAGWGTCLTQLEEHAASLR
jgi:hypothetical protein